MPSSLRRVLTADDLTEVIGAAFGRGSRITGVQRLRGGTKKGVYRVSLQQAGPPSVIVYSWAAGENFWTPAASAADPAAAHGSDPRDPFAPADGMPRLLEAVQTLVAGPLRLLEGHFPDRVFARSIAEHNTQAALVLLGE